MCAFTSVFHNVFSHSNLLCFSNCSKDRKRTCVSLSLLSLSLSLFLSSLSPYTLFSPLNLYRVASGALYLLGISESL
jgi:hypothetical protein